MNIANYIVFDFETDGLDTEKCQPLQLAAVVLDARTLLPYEGATFQTYIRPDFETLDVGVMEKNKITLEQLQDAPPLKVAWKQFAMFCGQYDVISEKSKKKPIPVGYNIQGYDLKIVDRLNKKSKQADFFNIFSVDVLDLAYMWFESDPIESLSFDSLRAKFNLSTEGAHNAIVDVKQCAEIFRHFIMLHRKVGQYIQWN